METAMRTSETTSKLFAALAKAQGSIKDPPMTGKGQAGRQATRYAMLGDIVPVIRAAFAPEGLSFVQGDDTERKCLVTRVNHSSGEWMETDYAKAWKPENPQQQGGNTTYAKRYALLMVAGIAGDPDDDGAAATKEAEKERKQREKEARADARVEKRAAKARRQAKHDDSWNENRVGFVMALQDRGLVYDDVKARLLDEGKTAPSNWTQPHRLKFMQAIDAKEWPPPGPPG